MHLQLTIVHRERNVVFVYISDSNYVLRVKEYITKVTDIPVGAQKLSFGGIELKNNNKLEDYHLPINAGLLLTLSQGYALRYQVFVKVSFRENPIRVRIGLGTTLKQILQSLSSSLQVPVDQLLLSYGGRMFVEEDTKKALVDLGVKSDEVLELTVVETYRWILKSWDHLHGCLVIIECIFSIPKCIKIALTSFYSLMKYTMVL